MKLTTDGVDLAEHQPDADGWYHITYTRDTSRDTCVERTFLHYADLERGVFVVDEYDGDKKLVKRTETPLSQVKY